VSLWEGQGSLVGSGLAAQAGDSTIDEKAIELSCQCSARELFWFKAAGEDGEPARTERRWREKNLEGAAERWRCGMVVKVVVGSKQQQAMAAGCVSFQEE
jgi:hypothetical protein